MESQKFPNFYTHTLKSVNPYTGFCVVKRAKNQRKNKQDPHHQIQKGGKGGGGAAVLNILVRLYF